MVAIEFVKNGGSLDSLILKYCPQIVKAVPKMVGHFKCKENLFKNAYGILSTLSNYRRTRSRKKGYLS